MCVDFNSRLTTVRNLLRLGCLPMGQPSAAPRSSLINRQINPKAASRKAQVAVYLGPPKGTPGTLAGSHVIQFWNFWYVLSSSTKCDSVSW